MAQPTEISQHEPAPYPASAAAKAAAAPRPARPPSRGTARKWRARLIVLVLLAAAVGLYVWVSASRATDATHITLGTVTLTAQAIPVETPRAGQVITVSVIAQQQVSAGQKLGTIEVTSTDSQGQPVVSELTLRAPRAGIVIDEPVTMGSTLQPGQPFVSLYDPTKLTFVTDMPLDSLTQIAEGMTARLKAVGTDQTITATVQRIVPRVGTRAATDPVDPKALRMVLVPANNQDVRGLIPGMRFTGTVNTLTGNPGHAKLIEVQ